MLPERTVTRVIGLALVMLFAVACGTPTIIEHPRPTLTMDEGVFRANDNPVIGEECGRGVFPSSMYGGLDPNHPVALCLKEWQPKDQCFRESGNIMYHLCERVLVYRSGAFLPISTREELRDLFAPIESADEALSYALLATDYSPKYDPEDYRIAVPGDCDPGPKGYRYYVATLEDTHVVEVESGYQVHLFDSQALGCGPHPVWSVIVQVNHDGTIASEYSRTKLFEERSGPMCCVD